MPARPEAAAAAMVGGQTKCNLRARGANSERSSARGSTRTHARRVPTWAAPTSLRAQTMRYC
eukprot:1813901-Alexandrium_andersonii.AAC.1